MSYSLYSTLLWIWIAMGVATFFLLLKVTAPFGRHTSQKWGPLISNRIGWIIMEGTVIIVFWYFVGPAIKNLSLPAIIMIALFSLHYLNRAIIFPFRLKTKGKKMPIVIMFSAIWFNLVNGSSLGYFFAHFSSYPSSWLTDGRFLLGIILFFTGMIINWKADDELIHLRKEGETGYKIPYGKLFQYISCPNHLGEIIEWSGFALLCWNLPASAFLIWTTANLVPRAIDHHKWYKEHFSEYPSERKAVIPFLL